MRPRHQTDSTLRKFDLPFRSNFRNVWAGWTLMVPSASLITGFSPPRTSMDDTHSTAGPLPRPSFAVIGADAFCNGKSRAQLPRRICRRATDVMVSPFAMASLPH